MDNTHFHNPVAFLAAALPRHPPPTAALIVLNQPLTSFPLLRLTWHNTAYRICADGGANRLRDCVAANLAPGANDLFLPHAIHGDLDSLTRDTTTYYDSRGVNISRDGDQNSTDLGKAFHKIRLANVLDGCLVKDVVILGSIGGRVDQGVGILHHMYRESAADDDLRLWLFGECSVSFLLKPGRNVIEARPATDVPGRQYKRELFTWNVGVLPIFGPASISTEGLQWNVRDWETSMVTRVSTSNHVVADQVVVETDGVVLFSMELNMDTLDLFNDDLNRSNISALAPGR